MENVKENAKKAWIKLVELANSRKTCTYKEIGDFVGIIPLRVGRTLEPIYDYCINEKLPPLTIIVVNKDTGLPRGGFENEPEKIPKLTEEVFDFNWNVIKNPFDYCSYEQTEIELQEKIKQAETLSNEKLQDFLSKSDPKPTTTITTHKVFNRNPHVVVAVLRRANGVCERCKKPAPFNKDRDNSPYLEVHHIIPLADNGNDTVENAVALCPNCHKHAHHGKNSYKMKIYAIYAQMEREPRCYVEAIDIDNLKFIMREREVFGMFPGWDPIEISRSEMYRILNNLDDDERNFQFYKQKYSVNITESDNE